MAPRLAAVVYFIFLAGIATLFLSCASNVQMQSDYREVCNNLDLATAGQPQCIYVSDQMARVK